MSNKLQTFIFKHNLIRVKMKNNEPYFCAKDICTAVEILNGRNVVGRLDKDDVCTMDVIDSMGRIQGMSFVNESGLYMLVFESRKEEALAFKRWIAKEVLPILRKTGSYSLSQTPQRTIPTSFADALRLAATQWEENQKLIACTEELKPKAEFFDLYADAAGLLSIAHAAKVIGTGQKRLFAWLREQHILMSTNIPYQHWIDQGYLVTKEKVIERTAGPWHYTQPFFTSRGFQWISRLYQEKAFPITISSL